DPDTAPFGLFERYNRYIGFLFTAGPELCWHYLTYYEYSGDEAFLKEEAYPVIKGVAEFMSNLLREGDDGNYHLGPANALETWWMVSDPTDTMDAIRWLYPEFIALSDRFGTDVELRQRCADQLGKLPDPPIGVWHPDGAIDETIDAYAPAAALGDPPKHCNFENPALYRVFPFGLSGIDSADYERAVSTFEHRIFPLSQGWSLDPVWAARLGLHDQSCSLLGEHTKKWNRFRYGGWDSGNSSVFPDGLSVVPYTDAPGVACYALNEILLQSHTGVIRILPAIAPDWSGTFRLRAQGGFLVSAHFQQGTPHFIEIVSLRANTCRLENPWKEACVVRSGGEVVHKTDSEDIAFVTEPNKTYWISPEERPLSVFASVPSVNIRNEHPGMPGRDR
ncbi:MAG: hypothetical protein GY851_21800, partial [bacterium]|nr:hypothetical protein [bacterium]